MERILLSQDRAGVVGSTRNIVIRSVHQIFGLAEDELVSYEGLCSV